MKFPACSVKWERRTFHFVVEYGFVCFFNHLSLALTPAGEDGVNLSGDQRQLLGFCRSLYRKPQVLLLDEPIASLDRETASFVHNLIHNIKSSCIVLVVTHLSDLMLLADRIYQLNCKKVKEKNTRLLTS